MGNEIFRTPEIGSEEVAKLQRIEKTELTFHNINSLKPDTTPEGAILTVKLIL